MSDNPHNLKPGDRVVCVDFSGSETGSILERIGKDHIYTVLSIRARIRGEPALVELDTGSKIVDAFITRLRPAPTMGETMDDLEEIHNAQELYANLEGAK